jgi:dipeptidyl aminopeptidase/acylaminoacyl peptidase
MFAPGNGLPQLFAGEGYATFLPNPRGSVGRGPEFAEANLGDMGGGDLQDILTGVDALVAEGIADDARVAIMGGSYGGFMSSWAVTQTNRFAAAVPFAVVTDWVSFHATTNIGQFDRLFLQAEPYDEEGEYTQRSPVYHAAKCKTPTLIIHGEDDLCTPVSQAYELYNALVEAGCETELVVYPREGHGWTEREHQLDAWNRMRDWLARYLSRD